MSLRKIKSALIKTIDLIMCASCINNRYEPRFIIILAVRSIGMNDSIKKMIIDHRYLGRVIEATDIV